MQRHQVLEALGRVLDRNPNDKKSRRLIDLVIESRGALDESPYSLSSPLAGTPVRFRFNLRSEKLYAFWVSPEESGASHGYVAAGGPGFTGPIETVGAGRVPFRAPSSRYRP